MSVPDTVLPIVLRCDPAVSRRVRYTFDSLFLAAGIPVEFVDCAPATGPWILYAVEREAVGADSRAVWVAHDSSAWQHFAGTAQITRAEWVDELAVVFPPQREAGLGPFDVRFDLAANAFYFLSSWSERYAGDPALTSRQLYRASDFFRLGVPQDIVDRYLRYLVQRVHAQCDRLGQPIWTPAVWPDACAFALVLSHDVDYLPVRPFDNMIQAAKAVLRHLIRQRDPADAWRAARGWLAALAAGRDPYGCVPEILAREQALGVRSSFQVAVGHRHPNDVNYHIDDDRVRDYLRAIVDAGFDLCLHGSYRSTEDPRWYREEVQLLGERLARPLGSRQHFLSFDYDTLFLAQEAAGIRYDMSMGFPDQPGPRAGFSYPYFPYNLREDRPFQVVQISLFLMDVTLRSYMGLRPSSALPIIEASLRDLHAKRGCASAVWHPIVFAGARDPGYGELYFEMADRTRRLQGLPTDGRTIDSYWRHRAKAYTSFSFA